MCFMHVWQMSRNIRNMRYTRHGFDCYQKEKLSRLDRSKTLELFNEELVPLYKGDTLIHDTRVKMHDTWCVHEQLLAERDYS